MRGRVRPDRPTRSGRPRAAPKNCPAAYACAAYVPLGDKPGWFTRLDVDTGCVPETLQATYLDVRTAADVAERRRAWLGVRAMHPDGVQFSDDFVSKVALLPVHAIAGRRATRELAIAVLARRRPRSNTRQR